MKVRLLLVIIITAQSILAHSQSPKLSLVGSNFSFAKGNIDIEVLTEIIQSKQDEVMERLFRNLVISRFAKLDDDQKSFATYSYIYNLLYTVTHEKNKTVITRQIINNLLEYCLVYGFTTDFVKNPRKANRFLNVAVEGKANKTMAVSIEEELITALENPVPKGEEKGFLKSTDRSEWATFNILLDMAYDVFLTDKTDSLHKRGLFKLLQEKPNLRSWYEKDNAYLKEKDKPEIIAIREEMESAYLSFVQKSFSGVHIPRIYNELESTDFKQEKITKIQYDAVKSILRQAIKALKTYTDNNIVGHISEYLLDYTLVEFAPEASDGGLGPQASGTKASTSGILYVDAEGLISSLHEKFVSNSKRSTVARAAYPVIPRPFFVIGATHSAPFSETNQLLLQNGSLENLQNIYFANEKVGLKFTFVDRKYTHSFEPGEEFKYHGEKRYWKFPQEEPLISRYELYVYGSGLLYNIVDIKSQENFNYTLIGTAFGVTFFNGLIINAGGAVPIDAKGDKSNKYMYSLSFDVPIIEYITAVRKKRNR